ncbi:MAG: type II toxin-antitoxin system VapB family antitoxin [Caldilineaceae bacterium]|nr:type II toxin-antitoxin system VapB family antitoxin [Caldilineaceae bacterium]
MRTNIVIDDTLLAEALACTGLSTKKAVVEEALRTLIRLKSQAQVRSLRGRLSWEGDLSAMRESRSAYATSHEAKPEKPTRIIGAGGDVDRRFFGLDRLF